MSFPAGPTVNGAKTAKSSLLAVNVAFYLARMGAWGIPAGQVLAGTELQPEQVQGVFRGTPAHYRTIIANMLRLTGDPFLGIALGDEFRISDFGVLGYAILSSATLRQSRSVMAEYYTLNEHPARMSRSTSGAGASRSGNLPAERHPFAAEEA